MKLLSVLKETIVSDKKVINEISASKKNALIKKFTGSTQDTEEQISSYIDEFEKFQNGLPADRRDIMRYSYDELKNLILQKKSEKNVDSIFKEFKKKEKGIPNEELKKYIKRFLEISSILPKNRNDISMYSYLELAQLVNENYPKFISKKLLEKFGKENPNLTVPQITYYIETYLSYIDEIPNNVKRVDEMSFSEFEHLVDGISATKGENEKKENNYADIDLRYDENNLKIFAPKTKDQCIKLRNNRTWCTSREGSSNLYYNYRFNQERTLYYVIDEDKEFTDLNFAVVILVDPYGGMSLADGSNSGIFSGHDNIPWNKIVEKVPKLKKLKEIFQPEPLTEEEKALIKKIERVKIGDDPKKSFENDMELEMWLEYLSPQLNDIQYTNLPNNLKKKYVALGMELTAGQLSNSEREIVQYYIKKQEEKLKNTNLNRLSTNDISLLNMKLLERLKLSLKDKFKNEALNNMNVKKDFDIIYPSNSISKFISLYGFDELFNDIPTNIEKFIFKNTSKENLIISLPENISEFKDLEVLNLENCIDKLPESIGQLPKLEIIAVNNNPKLTSLPDSIVNIESLSFINIMESPIKKFPKNFFEVFEDDNSSGIYTRK